MQKLGVLGGTFDPIHEGHLALARQAMEQAGLERIIFLPMACPAHREAAAPAADRLKMCRLALKGQEGFCLSEAGMKPGLHYTSESIRLLRREYPEAEFHFILGADKLPSLPYWYEADKLFEACSFLCYPRPGVSAEDALKKARAAGAQISMMAGPACPYSSSLIRSQTELYEDAPGLMKPVLCYMAERGLYQKDFLPALKGMMNAHRFRHTLGVRQEAVKLAAIHGLPIQKAALAALLHDCAKGMPVSQMTELAVQHHLVSDEGMLGSGAMLHGPVGALVAKEKFGIEDQDVLAAIRNHTIGRPGMSPLEMCVFVADATEPGREDYEGLSVLRALAQLSLPVAVMKSLQLTQLYLKETGRPFFPIALQTMAYLSAAMTENEKRLWKQYESQEEVIG